MQWICIVLLIAGILLLLLCMAPIDTEIHYTRRSNNDELRIRVRAFFGLFRYTFHIPTRDLATGRNRQLKFKADLHTGAGIRTKRRRPGITLLLESISRLLTVEQQLINNLHRFLPHLRKLTKVLQVLQFHWHTQFALGDAAVTATAAGALWSLKVGVLGLLSRFLAFEEMPDIRVVPRFQGVNLDTEIHCIIRLWLGEAIVAAVKMGIYLLREGKKPWQIIRYRV